MNFIKKNLALKDLFKEFSNYQTWFFLARFDLKLKYRRAFLGPWWVVLGMGLSAGILCLLWSTIFNLYWRDYLTYLFSGFIIWMYISSIVIEAPSIFSANKHLITSTNATPVFYVLRKCSLSLLLFLHHLPLIFIVIILVNPEIDLRVIFTFPLAIFIVFINAVFVTLSFGFLGARFRDVEPTVQSLMAPMFLLTPVLWKPEMLGESINLIYFNPFTYFVGILRNDITGMEFDAYLWIGSFAITFANIIIFLFIYSSKKNRLIFWL
jgi:ABC-2 type transport system permease protein/lipopolysaccharide transport system permease protein